MGRPSTPVNVLKGTLGVKLKNQLCGGMRFPLKERKKERKRTKRCAKERRHPRLFWKKKEDTHGFSEPN
jgi:hypothetical protein